LPTATAQAAGGTTTVHAIWNGATEVARWDVIGSGDGASGDPRLLASSTWDGLDTAIPLEGDPKFVRVVAKDRFGHEIGRSPVTAVTQ
jgi:hypothetical protein